MPWTKPLKEDELQIGASLPSPKEIFLLRSISVLWFPAQPHKWLCWRSGGACMNEQLEMDGMGPAAPQMGSLLKSPYRGSAAWADSAGEPTPSPSWRRGLAGQCWITGWPCWLRRDKEKMWTTPVIVRLSIRQRSWGENMTCVLRALLWHRVVLQ